MFFFLPSLFYVSALHYREPTVGRTRHGYIHTKSANAAPSQRGVGVLISTITIMKLVGNNKMGRRQWIRLPDFETAPLALAVYAPGCLTTTGVECCV